MCGRRTAWFLVLVVTVATNGGPAALAGQDESPFADLRIESLTLSAIDAHGAEAIVQIAATANQPATLQSLVFERLTVNGVPINVPPVHATIRLRPGQPVDGLPLLKTRLSFESLDSLEPLRRLVSQGSGRVNVVIRGQLRLNLFQKIALLAGDAWVVSHLDKDVPVEIPGGALGRLAGLAALTAAEPIWLANSAFRIAERTIAETFDEKLPAIGSSILALETRYQLRSRSGEVASLRHWSSGFVVGAGTVITSAEALEPWAFDRDVAEALDAGTVSVVESSFELTATPASGGTSFTTRDGGIRIAKRLTGSTKIVSPSTRRRYSLRFRDHEGNAALLQIPGWTGPALSPADRPITEWRPAVIIVPRWQNGKVEPAPRQTAIRFESDRYRLRDALDAAAFGAPVWTATGVVGLLQDEGSAAAVTTLMRRLR